MSVKNLFGRTAAFAVVGGLLSFAGAIPAHADRDDHDRDREKCERRVHKAEENLERAVRKHGEHSRQAEQRRHQVEETRESCHMGDRDHDRH